MRHSHRQLASFLLVASFLPAAFVGTGIAQEPQAAPASIEVSPTELELRVGDSVQLRATVRDADGNELDVPVVFLPLYGQFWNLEQSTWGFNLFDVSVDGVVTASKPGRYAVLVRAAARNDPERAAGGDFLQVEVPLTILQPAISTVDFVSPPGRFFEGMTVRLDTRLTDAAGAVRNDVDVTFASSDPEVAMVDDFGDVRLLSTGTAELVARAENASASLRVRVEPNPVARLELDDPVGAARIRTGDVVRFTARALDESGNPIDDVRVMYSFFARTDAFAVGGPSSGLVAQDGRFVADLPGRYTVVATAAGHSVSRSLRVVPRNVKKRIELVGHGRVRDRGTSDLWVWEAPDGRDYAITGTHSAEGHAYIWDVTEPANITLIDMISVDARTVNDVKVSADGRVAVMSREGASNRRNGIVLLDVSDPANGARILATYDDELTGGVHNTFIYEDHVYALSAGQRYDIINIEDPTNPHRVGRFQLPNPDTGIHDVWVANGIAYSANWNDGVVMVDVGGGDAGGSPTNPVLMDKFSFPTGWNHAVYPYESASADKFYVFAGDEAARTSTRFTPVPEIGSGTPGYAEEPNRWRGWIHILEWGDDEPKIVGRYEVPEAGSHNIWVEDDVMYVAFYNGGLRVVDVSGELMGDLYRQGREIAYFLPFDPEGFKPNSPEVWGAQPHKGTIFFTDYNSGLWAVRLVDGETESH